MDKSGLIRIVNETLFTKRRFSCVTRDYSRWMSANDVFDNVKHYTRPGSILTFHDSLKAIGKLRTALPASIQWLKEQGYEFRIFE